MKPRLSQLAQSGAADGDVATWDDTAGIWVPAAPTGGGGGSTVQAKFAKRTAGDVTLSANTYGAVDTALDLTLTAATNDIIEVGISGRGDFTSNSRFIFQDIVTLVSGSAVNYLSGAGSTGEGVQGWAVENVNSWRSFGGSILYKIVSGDLASGNVTLRYVARLNTTGSTRKISASTSNPLHFFAKNLGQ
jgi:hypothetical protein